MTKTKGGVRDKVKRVLLIEGTPSVLYRESERIFTSVKINNRIYRLGAVADGLIEELIKIPSFEVRIDKSERSYPVTIKINGIGNRATIRKVNGNTHIQVGAEDEEQLEERVNKIKEYLLKNGVEVKEKCGWVCVIDKSKVRELSYERATEEVQHYLRQNKEYSIGKIASHLMIEYKLVERILNELGYKMKKKEQQEEPEPRKERTKRLREMVIRMGVGAE